ncbi:MAG: SPOR domain-containing protein [Pseudomonadota bacterium]
MRLAYFAIIGIIAGTGFASQGAAKTLAEAALPANFPPASYSGRSYVDNDGCVYIRAEVDGITTWVPRVTRSRQTVCGQAPTFGSASAASEPLTGADVEGQSLTSEVTVGAPSAQRARASVSPTLVASAAPSNSTPSANAPAAPALRVVEAPASITATTRSSVITLPEGQFTSDGQFIPKGFRPVWTDGRLNPNRGIPPGKPVSENDPTKGYDLAWTRGTPRLLYDRRTGLVVGDEFPGLTYPNLDPTTVATQETVRGSTSSAAPALRHIQVATFASMEVARPAAQRLANTGFRTRIGKYTHGGEARQVIILGPFDTKRELNRALDVARGQGFTQAFARK